MGFVIIHPPADFEVFLYLSSVGPAWDFKLFGDLLNHCTLTTTAVLLLDNATLESSRKSCKSGNNQFRKFALKYMGAHFVPKKYYQLSIKGLVLSFFTASLFLNKKKLKSSTIRNYVTHVKTSWEKSGANLTNFDKIILSRLLKGVATLRPAASDKRTAFLLPHFKLPAIFKSPYSKDQLLFRAAVIFGFFGMLRFSTFNRRS